MAEIPFDRISDRIWWAIAGDRVERAIAGPRAIVGPRPTVGRFPITSRGAKLVS